MDIYTRLRSRTVLHRAWFKVRASGLAPDSSEKTKQKIREFEVSWLNNLEKIQNQLRREIFTFTGEKGIALPKEKGKVGFRPVVLAPINNRIVRRAILDVLQGYKKSSESSRAYWDGIPAVRRIMQTPTSIGGIAERGVPDGLALIDQAVNTGNCWFVRSDIKNFFTRIPKGRVNAFIRKAVRNRKFANLFEQALATNLDNEEELKERNHFKLFPDPEVGVAQGSALSALAGNIVLKEFDQKMNCRDIICVRYIDDFILLGPTKAKVLAAYHSAKKMLSEMEMDVYDLSDTKARGEGKVDDGNIYNGTDVLGYRVSGMSRQPCKKARKKFLEKLDRVVADCTKSVKAAACNTSSDHRLRYHQSLVKMHDIIWGWSQSFRHTTAKHVFESIDKEIEKRIVALEAEVHKLISIQDVATHRRVIGVHLLADTRLQPLPKIA